MISKYEKPCEGGRQRGWCWCDWKRCFGMLMDFGLLTGETGFGQLFNFLGHTMPDEFTSPQDLCGSTKCKNPWMISKTFQYLATGIIGHGFLVDTSQSRIVRLELKCMPCNVGRWWQFSRLWSYHLFIELWPYPHNQNFHYEIYVGVKLDRASREHICNWVAFSK